KVLTGPVHRAALSEVFQNAKDVTSAHGGLVDDVSQDVGADAGVAALELMLDGERFGSFAALDQPFNRLEDEPILAADEEVRARLPAEEAVEAALEVVAEQRRFGLRVDQLHANPHSAAMA